MPTTILLASPRFLDGAPPLVIKLLELWILLNCGYYSREGLFYEEISKQESVFFFQKFCGLLRISDLYLTRIDIVHGAPSPSTF